MNTKLETDLDIKMVRGFVEQQNMRVHQRKRRKRHTRFLTSRQSADQLQPVIRKSSLSSIQPEWCKREKETLPCHTADLEIAEMASVFLFRFSGEPGRQELNRRQRWVERVDVVLRKVASA